MIRNGKLLHISASQELLSKLPAGNWIGGSTIYFATEAGQEDTEGKLWVFELGFDTFKIEVYDEHSIEHVTEDAYANGFTLIILPAETNVLQDYAMKSLNYKNIFLKNVLGWVAGTECDEKPLVVDGKNARFLNDKAVALHISLPEEKIAVINVVNIFTANDDSPIIEFEEEDFFAKDCIINGKKECLVDYAAAHGINLHFPIVGEYSGSEINTTIVNIAEDKVVTFAAPLFKGIKYRFAKPLSDYAGSFVEKISSIPNKDYVVAWNCVSNMRYGNLQKRDLGGFYGPYVYGEIAYQLVNQTVVYLQIH